MNETVVCTCCQAQLVLPGLPAGQTVQCPRCQHVFEPFRQHAGPVAAVAPRFAEDDTEDEPRGIVRPLPLAGEKLAVTAIWLLGVCCLFFVILLYLHIDRAWIVAEMKELEIGAIIGQVGQARMVQLQDQLFDSLQRAHTMVTLTSLAFWPTVVIYLMWLYRASSNLRLLQADGVSHTPGGAVISYFVPIANLFRPLMQMKEIWRASDPEHIDHGRAWQQFPAAMIINAWWISFLLTGIVAFIGSCVEPDPFLDIQIEGRGNGFRHWRDESAVVWTYASAYVGILVAGSLLILIIRGITQRQRERFAQLYHGQTGY